MLCDDVGEDKKEQSGPPSFFQDKRIDHNDFGFMYQKPTGLCCGILSVWSNNIISLQSFLSGNHFLVVFEQ